MLIFKNLNSETKRWLPLKAGSTTDETVTETHSPKAGIRSFQSVKQGIFMESSILGLSFFQKIWLPKDKPVIKKFETLPCKPASSTTTLSTN